MKKLLILLLFTGCTTLNHIPPESIYYGFDFRKYAERDFLITPEMYQGEYMTMGIINYEVYPEANFIPVEISKPFGGTYEKKSWVQDIILPKWAVDSIYVFCKRWDADALANFKMDLVEKRHGSYDNIVIIGIKISGYAIKRLD